MNLPKELIIECMKYSPVFPLICKYFNSIYDSGLTKIIKDIDTTNCSRVKIEGIFQINKKRSNNARIKCSGLKMFQTHRIIRLSPRIL